MKLVKIWLPGERLIGYGLEAFVAQELQKLGLSGFAHTGCVATICSIPIEGKERNVEKCWEIKGCQEKDTCRAFPHFGRSCWLIKGKLSSLFGGDGEEKSELHCDSCEVYQWQTALSSGCPSKNAK